MNAPMALMAAVSMLIRYVSAGATTLNIGLNAVARLPFNPASAVRRLLMELLVFASCLASSVKLSVTAERSLRNRKYSDRMPRPYFSMVISPRLKPLFA